MHVTLDISDEHLAAAKLSACDVELEAKKELALAFYARGLLSAGKASELAGLTRRDFDTLLAKRRQERPISSQHLGQDAEWAMSAGGCGGR